MVQPASEPEPTRVKTAGWRVAQPPGGGLCLRAGRDATGQEAVSALARVRGQCQPADGARPAPRPVGASTDGAPTRRCQWAALVGQPVPVRLDWAHLDTQGGEMRSRVARTKQAKAVHVQPLLDSRWHGPTEAALAYLQPAVRPKDTKQQAACVTSLEQPQTESIASGRRQWAGTPMGRGRMAQGVDQVIGARQQHKGLRWSPTGSTALGL